MDYSRIVTIDFETRRVEPRPKYPPEPVGVAIRWPDGRHEYLSWGHPSGNNCDRDYARTVLEWLMGDEQTQILAHNAAFEFSICVERLGLRMPPWNRIHDTMFLLFLHNPHSDSLGLKEAAARLLDWPPDEQDAVRNWIIEHRKQLEADYGEGKWKISTTAKRGDSSTGAWISYAPGDLVGLYAKGDVVRTFALFCWLYPKIRSWGMEEAYDRERKLLPILMENERQGLMVDLAGLEKWEPIYTAGLEQAEALMREYLQAPDLDFNNDRDIAEAFQRAGVVHEDRWVRTKKSGQLSVSKENLTLDCFVDPLFAHVFGYRNRMETCLKMFVRPWIEQARANDGYIHTSWNQVRNSRSGDDAGARTGRPSMSKPNMLNVSKSFDGRDDLYEHPRGLPIELPELPLMRDFILPDPGQVWLHRDFNGQELRVFGHYECGELTQAYLANPRLDVHDLVKDEMVRLAGREFDRTKVKTLNFQGMYGGGVPAAAKKLRVSHAEAKEFKAFHDRALPGRKILSDELTRIVRSGEPIRTWGGRLYHVEPPSYSKEHGRVMSYEYKLINYLVQGSAADLTKEAIVDWYYGGSPFSRFLLTVYDEINISSPPGLLEDEMAYLKEVMERPRLDVPMLSDGKMGVRWGKLEKYED